MKGKPMDRQRFDRAMAEHKSSGGGIVSRLLFADYAEYLKFLRRLKNPKLLARTKWIEHEDP